jgi:FkbM family methyltransferase
MIPILQRNREFNACHFQIEHGILTRTPQARISVCLMMDSNQLAHDGVDVPVLCIEDLESKYTLRFDTLVMDIEGGEYNVLHENVARLSDLKAAIIEFHPGLIGAAKTRELYRLLSDAGLLKVDEILTTQAWLRT